jgi:hypothetical protein
MNREYYIRRNEESIGPLSIDEIKKIGCQGDTPVWHNGLNEWSIISKVPELAATIEKQPPPFNGHKDNNSDSYESKRVESPPPFHDKKDSKATTPKIPVQSAQPKERYVLIGVAAVILILITIKIATNNNSAQYIDYSPINDSIAAANANGTDHGMNDSLRMAQSQGSMSGSQYTESPALQDTRNSVDEITLQNMEYRNNWHKYITASRSNYSYSAAGGISGLSIVVYNTTSYPVDYVAVTVRYITVNGYTHKTETVSFYDIPPGSKQAMQAQNSERGTSVEYEITNIYAPRFKFCYDQSDLQGNGSIKDPWKCLN